MARKKSKGSKKSRAKKTRRQKSTPARAADAPGSVEQEGPEAAAPAPTDEGGEPSGSEKEGSRSKGDEATSGEDDTKGRASSKTGGRAKKKRKKKKEAPPSKKEAAKKKDAKASKKKASPKDADVVTSDGDSGKKARPKQTDAPTKGKGTSRKKQASRKKHASGKRQPSAKEDPTRTGEAEGSEVLPADDVIDLDLDDPSADLGNPAEDLDALIAAAAEEPPPVAIDIEDDLDDAEARRRLIEEAVAFAEAEERGVPPDAEATRDDLQHADADPRPAPSTEAQPAPSTEAGDDPASADEDVDPVDGAPTEEGRPRIGAEALLALSEIHAEGLASIPGELVLDLGEASTPEERDRLLAAALAHAEMQEAIYRVPTEELRSRRIKTGIAAALTLAAALTAWNPPGLLVPAPPPALSETDRADGVLVALTLQAQQIEAFRAANGRLPRSLAEVESPIPDVRFVRSSNRLYQLLGYDAAGEPVVFDSEAPAPAFERLWRSWSTTSGERRGGLR